MVVRCQELSRGRVAPTIISRGQPDAHADQRHGRRGDPPVHAGVTDPDRKVPEKRRHRRHGDRRQPSGFRRAVHGMGRNDAGLSPAPSRSHPHDRRIADSLAAAVRRRPTLVAIPENRAAPRRHSIPGRARDSGAAAAHRPGLHQQLRRASVLARSTTTGTTATRSSSSNRCSGRARRHCCSPCGAGSRAHWSPSCSSPASG